MINRISGVITEKNNDFLYIETGGIEWELQCSTKTLQNLPSEGKDSVVFTYLQHKEDIMKLYGFSDKKERIVFIDLLKVSGVGPKLAIKILSGIKVEEFRILLDTEDVTALSRIPGLGKKTAQKIILTLRGKLKLEDDEVGDSEKSNNELLQSLVSMGFDRKSTQKVVLNLEKLPEIKALDKASQEKEILRRAIISLST